MMSFSIVKGLFLLLMFVISIEGTIALRNTLITFIIAYLVFHKDILIETYIDVNSSKELKSFSILLLIFLFYVLIHTYFISLDFYWSIDEWRAHLLYPVVYFFIGMAVANFVIYKKIASANVFLTAIFFSIFLHIIYIDLQGINYLIDNGKMLRRFGGFMDSPTLANYLTNILIAFLTAEYIYRLRSKQRFLQLSNGFLHLAIVALIFSTFIESLRLGDISLVLLAISASIVFTYKNNAYSRNSKILIVSLIVLVLSIPLAYNLMSDPRWGKLVETVPVALDTANSEHWINASLPPPKSESGFEVKGSNYQRIAWARKSLEWIIEEPMGIGFGRNAFGHAMRIHHPDLENLIAIGQTSHSSILDLTIGIGILGTVLWVIFIFNIAIKSVKIFASNGSFFSILTLFLTIGYFSRGLVDANMRDHMLLQFMLILGIVVFYLFNEVKKNEENISN